MAELADEAYILTLAAGGPPAGHVAAAHRLAVVSENGLIA
jgi:hypothetical protein